MAKIKTEKTCSLKFTFSYDPDSELFKQTFADYCSYFGEDPEDKSISGMLDYIAEELSKQYHEFGTSYHEEIIEGIGRVGDEHEPEPEVFCGITVEEAFWEVE